MQLKRLAVYVDGFNLYRGMRSANMRNLLWLDLFSLAERICPKDARVVAVKYFTAHILNLKRANDPQHAQEEASRRRQLTYISALESRGVQIFLGRYKRRHIQCRACGAEWIKPEEKMSDVQLATHMLVDAFRGEFDMAMVVSGDADVVPPIEVVVRKLSLPVVVAFPPKRILRELGDKATGVIHINKRHLVQAQLPKEIAHKGHTLMRPAKWS